MDGLIAGVCHAPGTQVSDVIVAGIVTSYEMVLAVF